MPRTLTKSRFRLAQECPTKLFYTGKPNRYANSKLEDSFLEALAEGGFQVGELAKSYHPGGIEVEGLDPDHALQQTAEHLRREEVTLYEPAFLFEGLFIRVDVLVKAGESIDLIEVKAKSCSGESMDQFLTSKGEVKSDWRPYLEDVAFQKFVVRSALAGANVRGHLMLADKRKVAPEDGLHQKFLLEKDQAGRARVRQTAPLSAAEQAQPVLTCIDVDEILERLLLTPEFGVHKSETFDSWVAFAAREYASDQRIDSPLGSKCKSCEFRASEEEKRRGLESGFDECWSKHSGLNAEELSRPTVLDIGNFRGADRLIQEGRYAMDQVEPDDVGFDGHRGETLSSRERQWLQVERAQTGSNELELRRNGLQREMNSWTYPLHFIDFETAMPAIPLHRGRSPYTPLAFQFSHHVVHEDGCVEHRGEFLNSRCGEFPNVEFLRALRADLAGDEGTIFRYAAHENSILAALREQLLEEEAPDREELIAFIESIAHARRDEKQPWPRPDRIMVDLCDLVKRYIYDPRTNGSNSIKKVLPATLERSDFLQRKYSEPVYGGEGNLRSLNFESMTWVQRDENGKLRDPYDLLPPLFAGATREQLDSCLTDLAAVQEGGAAMTAWARTQATEMSDYEREELRASLLKYCELDTLAMVMLYEAWRDWCGDASRS